MIAALPLAFVLVVVAVAVSVVRSRRADEVDEDFITPTGYARLGMDSGRQFASERRTEG